MRLEGESEGRGGSSSISFKDEDECKSRRESLSGKDDFKSKGEF